MGEFRVFSGPFFSKTKVLGIGKAPPPLVEKKSQIIPYFTYEGVPKTSVRVIIYIIPFAQKILDIWQVDLF